ncbi:MAG: MaoC/PaaZ C-terminal domain-containing protein [Syntrophobacteraceae bacterium]
MATEFFEDLREGDRLHCRPVGFTRQSIVDFAEEFDPQPFHIDEKKAKISIFGGLVASALHVLSACTRVVVEAQGDLAIISGLGMDEVKIFNPVRPEDTLEVDARWVDLKRSKTKQDRGFARVRCKVSNQKGQPVFEFGYQYLIACRDYPAHHAKLGIR